MTEVHPHLACLENMSVPDEASDIAYKVELFLIRGQPRKALRFWQIVTQRLAEDNRRLDVTFYKELHFRVARMAFDNARLELIRSILEDIPEAFHELPVYGLFRHLLGHYRMVEEYRPYFPLNVSFEQRHDGPHLFDEPDDGREITRWAAGRVEEVKNGDIFVILADYAEDGQREGRMKIPPGTLEKWHSDRHEGDVEEGDYFEFVAYDGDEENPHIKWWGGEWDGWKDLPPLHTDPNRYLRQWGWVRDGRTFTDKCIRGEEDPENIDDYVDQWHKGECEWSVAWTLADHLGMLPEEYAQWVENPDALEDIIEERRTLWKEKGYYREEWDD